MPMKEIKNQYKFTVREILEFLKKYKNSTKLEDTDLMGFLEKHRMEKPYVRPKK